MQLTELNQSKADALNQLPGTLGYGDCPVCKNKGYIAYVAGKDIATKECECMKARGSRKKLEKSGLIHALSKYRMDSYKVKEEWQKDVMDTAMRYLQKGRGRWFFVSGRPGSGKTHICTALCGEILAKNIGVRYMMWRSDAPRMKSYVNDSKAYLDMFNDFCNADVLYIDDFFKGEITQADINLAYDILNYRYINKAVGTIISSEHSIEEILDIDEALGSRIVEKSMGYCILTGDENYRLKGI